MTKMTTICFTNDEYKMIKTASNMYDESITDFMKKAILDRVEDSIDYKEAIASKEESNEETVSREEIVSRTGFKFSDYYNEENIRLSEDRVESLLMDYLKEYDRQTYLQKLSENATR